MSRLRYSTRLIALAVLGIAVFLGYWNRIASQRQRLAESIMEKGGMVYWSDQPTSRFVPSFLAGCLPREYCFAPLSIDTVKVAEDELASISRLFPALKELGLKDANLGGDGLDSLGRMSGLTYLRIYGDACPDLAALSSCAKLRHLDVDTKGFGDKELTALEDSSLQLIMLFQADITMNGLQAIANHLPDCDINVFPGPHDDHQQTARLSYMKDSKTFLSADP